MIGWIFFINLKDELQKEGYLKFDFCQAFINMFFLLIENNTLTLIFSWITLGY